MSPTLAMQDLGLPLISCIVHLRRAMKKGINFDVVLSGRLYNGSHLVKTLALGASGIAMGRPFLISCYAYRFSSFVITKLYIKIISLH